MQTLYLCKDNFEDKSSSVIATISNNLFLENIIINEDSNSLLICGSMTDKNQGVIQEYDMSNGNLLYSYLSKDTEIIMELLKKEGFCFVGGSENLLKIMDTDTNKFIIDPIKTSIGIIFQMELCEIKDPNSDVSKIVLALAGKLQDYSNNQTDLFDVTALFEVNLYRFNSNFLGNTSCQD